MAAGDVVFLTYSQLIASLIGSSGLEFSEWDQAFFETGSWHQPRWTARDITATA